jgi:glycosyltransferase involved in cell wall biosynthesis
MKVAFVTTVYAPNEIGGAERTVRTLAEALVRHGHEVLVISLDPRGGRTSSEINGVRVYYLPLHNLFWPYAGPKRAAWKRLAWHAIDAFNPWMGVEVAQVLRRERPDVVQMGNLQGLSVAAWLAASRLGIPVVQMLHDYYLGCANAAMFKRGANCTSQCASCRVLAAPRRALSGTPHTVISLSHRTLDRLESCGLFEQVARKEILHGACDLRALPSQRSDKPAGTPIVLGYLGRLEQIKGIEVLLDAAAALPADKLRVLLGGTGSEAYLTELQRRCGAAPNVEFLGFVPPAELFARIDALVVPSVWEEPLGRVIYEGYHYGVPAIVARSGGMPEIVDVDSSGYVFEAGDAHGLSQIIARELARGWRGARFAQACLAKSHEFSISVMYERYFEIWQTAAQSRSHSPRGRTRSGHVQSPVRARERAPGARQPLSRALPQLEQRPRPPLDERR